MRCPNCRCYKTEVKNTRHYKRKNGEISEIYDGWMERKRYCPECKCYFWTIEQFDRYTDDTQMKLISDFVQTSVKDEQMLQAVRDAVGVPPQPLKLKLNLGGRHDGTNQTTL